jgi:NAD(P)-dependent dehydrogenase (short-subunit alcohol dehydrogenase family)
MGSVTGPPARPRSVVITGASSGLGRAAAVHLSDLGYRVFAGVHTDPGAVDFPRSRSSSGEIIPVLLDVTDPASIAQAGQFVAQWCHDSGLWAVVNNAGICVCAPLELIPPDVMRVQMETNVIGALAVSQQFLPLLRKSGGRIINISSGIANLAPPYLGAYAAAQFAKEGMSDSLRRELRPLGVSVSVVQPGAVQTPMWHKMRQSANEIFAASRADIVQTYRHRFAAFLDTNVARATASRTTPGDYADAVATALAARRPKARYRVGADSRISALARRVMPDRLMDALIGVALKAGQTATSHPPGPEVGFVASRGDTRWRS